MTGRPVPVEWQGRAVDAWVPDPVADAAPSLSVTTVRRVERGIGTLRVMGERSTGSLEVAARFLLRAEGLASSAIEGVEADAADVAVAELAGAAHPGDVVHGGGPVDQPGWVADNLGVVVTALEDRRRLTNRRLWDWHERLMARRSLEPGLVGAWRDRVGWVGGVNPLVAAHVASPPGDIDRLMADLLAFLARHDLDPVTKAAVGHAQFETIHPFADGNGRIGRVLVSRILAHDTPVPVPPPVSLAFARDIGGYLAGLTLYRQGEVDRWVRWFADTVEASAERSAQVLTAVDELRKVWHDRLTGLRADAAARRLADELIAHPAITAQVAAERCRVSAQAARAAIGQLVDRGVLVEHSAPARRTVGRPAHWFVATELLALLGR